MDFYRGTLSARRLGVLIRQMPADSTLVTALNEGPRWSTTDNLIADLWALIVKVNSDPDKVSGDIDHPLREEMTAKVIAAHKAALKEEFRRRKSAYAGS